MRTTHQAVKLLAIGAVGAAALGLTACGDDVVKTGQMEDSISKQFAAQGLSLKSVKCDSGTKAKVGESIRCTGLNEAGTKLNITGSVTAIKDKRASYRVKVLSGVAKGSVISTQALATAKQQNGKVTGLTCPDEIPLPTKPAVTCAATTSDGKTYDAKIAIDDQSQLRLTLASKPR
jgi:hypothetical protein